MAYNSINEENLGTAWTPDLFGPIFKKDSLTLKQALYLRNVDEQIHLMATFVPDEIVYTDLSDKSFRSFQAVLMFLNVSGFSTLFKKYTYDKKGGSPALTTILNNYVYIVVHEIYCNKGDILKFSAQGLLAAWKVSDDEFMFNVVQKVIICAMCVQNSVVALKDADEIFKVNIAISVGDVTFSVIGNSEARHFVIFGLPIEELKQANKISLANDLIITLSAWQHCTPSEYEYVIKNPYNIKIVRVLKQPDAKLKTPISNVPTISKEIKKEKVIERKSVTPPIRPSSPYRARISINGKLFSETAIADTKKKTSTAISAIAEENPDFAVQLRSYLIKPVIQQIEKGISLRLLAEVRRITVVSLDIVPNKSPNNELILLVDKCFILLHSIVTQYAGCINTMNLYEKNILFCIVFGIRGSDDDDPFKIDEPCTKGITFAMHALQTIKDMAGIQSVFVGVSTGMAYCGVVGDIARKYYAIIGPPVTKVMKIMVISYNKVSCDYDTVMHSNLKKYQFRSRGVRIFGRLDKFHVYEYLGDKPMRKDITISLDYCYPILDRMQELECFDDILDEIGVTDQKYSGLLIEGSERSGKSRLLDAFVKSVYNRQIKLIKLSLHVTYADKAYSVIYHIMLQIFEAEDCDTVEEREKTLLLKLGKVLALKDFCYLNVLMRVHFPLSDVYCSESDLQRHIKTLNIFEMILKQLKIKICILLDDIQHMDYMSWQFLSSALNNNNIIVAMTMLKPNSWEELSHVEVEIYKDKRFMKRILLGLNVNLLPTFACQFLNVFAIPRKLNRDLQRRKDGHIGWCETLLTLILQSNGLDFIKTSPDKAKRYDLFFADTSLVTKLPIDLTPDELAPPLHWSQISELDICVTNENYFKIVDIDRDMKELMGEIYDKMNPYEHSLINCAATLGKAFKRSMLENVIPNSIPPHTLSAVSEMIRIRILECTSLQRRDFHTEDLIYCIDKKRRTFSDMHHLVSCHCYHSQATILSSPLYAHCKMLEFKVDLFRSIVYNMQSNEEKQDHHVRAVKLYGLDARKCNSCGNDHFLRVPSKDKFTEEETPSHLPSVSLVRHRTLIANRNNKSMSTKSSILPTKAISPLKKEECPVDVRRVSIMPTYLDIPDEEERAPKEEEKAKEVSLINESLRFWKRPASVAPEPAKTPLNYLDEFSHIDYRNCQCDSVISHLFWRLQRHIENCGKIDKLIDFFMEYSAGLITTMQPLYAIKLLTIATEKNEAIERAEWTDDNVEQNITNKGIILTLMGDAHTALGNYDQAKKYYTKAVKLRNSLAKVKKTICYCIISKIYCQMRYAPPLVNEVSRRVILKKLEVASYLRRLCVVYMIENKLKTAQAYALKSFMLTFSSSRGHFLEKGEIYLVTVQVLHRTKNIELIQYIERPMLAVIKAKISWQNVEEMTMIAKIYLMMYQVRALRGELEEAINIGIKVLKISRALHLNKLILVIVPSLIQIMLWTKRINEAVDLIRELYFLAEEDVDLSNKTWYYALSLEFILDAGVVLDSYETFHNYYEKCIDQDKSKFWRDPQSLCRLLSCLWLYQLRMGHIITDAFTSNAEEFIKDISCDNFSQIFTCIKGLECHLLMLLHCINMKQSDELDDLTQAISKIIKCLGNVSKHAMVVKPCLYMLMAYLNVLRGCRSTTRFYLHKAQKFAILQGNKLMEAWIIQNRRTWKEKLYNNMARYWVEYAGSADFVAWQYIPNFSINTWSTILYPLPIPDSHL